MFQTYLSVMSANTWQHSLQPWRIPSTGPAKVLGASHVSVCLRIMGPSSQETHTTTDASGMAPEERQSERHYITPREGHSICLKPPDNHFMAQRQDLFGVSWKIDRSYKHSGWQWKLAASAVLAHWRDHLPCEQPKASQAWVAWWQCYSKKMGGEK